MDYLITNLIDEIIWQLQDVSISSVIAMAYFGTVIAEVAGKYAALRENDKALNPIANAFYEGAAHGVSRTWRYRDRIDIHFMQEVNRRLDVARRTKRSVWT